MPRRGAPFHRIGFYAMKKRFQLQEMREAVVARQRADAFSEGQSFARRGRPIVENPHSPIDAKERFDDFNAGWSDVARRDTAG